MHDLTPAQLEHQPPPPRPLEVLLLPTTVTAHCRICGAYATSAPCTGDNRREATTGLATWAHAHAATHTTTRDNTARRYRTI